MSLSPEIQMSQIRELVDSIEIANLSGLNHPLFGQEWTYHFRFRDPLNPESGGLNLLHLEEIKKAWEISEIIIEQNPPEMVSLHLGFSAEKREKVSPDGHNTAISPVLPKEEIFGRFQRALKWVLGASPVPIAVENMDYHPGGAYEHICNPVFITEILAEFPSLYLLLDVAHTEISAANFFGAKPEERIEAFQRYLRYLPLNRIIEVHINSPEWKNGEALDMHFPISEVEENILSWLLKLGLPNLKVINLECDTEVETQLRKLRRLAKGGT